MPGLVPLAISAARQNAWQVEVGSGVVMWKAGQSTKTECEIVSKSVQRYHTMEEILNVCNMY